MKVLDYLVMLRERDVEVWADGDRLRCSARAGVLSTELRAELRQRREEILKFLRSAEAFANQQHAIVPLQPRGNATPVFAVAGHNGDVFCFRSLAQQLGAGQPFFGLQPPGLDGRREPLARVEDLAAYFAAQIRAIRPDGPYIIAGYCAGGTIAFELALQLLRDGATVQGLALFGSPFPTWYRILPQLRERANQLVSRVVRHSRALAAHSAAAGRSYIAERLRNLKAERAAMRSATPDPVLAWREKVGRATLLAIRQYLPRPFSGRLSLFWPSRQCRCGGDSLARWQTIASSAIETYFGPDGCDGATMLREPYAATFGGHFKLFTQGASNGKITLPEQAATGHRRLENERAGLEAAVRLTQSAQRNW